MDKIQLEHEKAVAENFMTWFNNQSGTNFKISGRPIQAPDWIYKDENEELYIEICDVYYDEKDALMKWKIARDKKDAPMMWSGTNFDRALIENINKALKEKGQNDYGTKCILLINIQPSLTTIDDLEKRLGQITTPNHKFKNIYLTGYFPQSSNSSGGYNYWKLF